MFRTIIYQGAYYGVRGSININKFYKLPDSETMAELMFSIPLQGPKKEINPPSFISLREDEFSQIRTSPRVNQMKIFLQGDIEVILQDGTNVNLLRLFRPIATLSLLDIYLKHHFILVHQLDNGEFGITMNVRGMGGGKNQSKIASPTLSASTQQSIQAATPVSRKLPRKSKDVLDNLLREAVWDKDKYNRNASIQELLDEGADPSAKTDDWGTVLFQALIYHFIGKGVDSEELVLILLRAGADPSARGRNGETPLHKALYIKQNKRIVSMLLEKGAKPSMEDIDAAYGNVACGGEYIETYGMILSAGNDLIPVRDRLKHLKKVLDLKLGTGVVSVLVQGSDTTSHDCLMLIMTSFAQESIPSRKQGLQIILEKLLENSQNLGVSGNGGEIFFISVCSKPECTDELILMLLKYVDNIDVADSRGTALTVACINNNKPVIKVLLEKGADIRNIPTAKYNDFSVELKDFLTKNMVISPTILKDTAERLASSSVRQALSAEFLSSEDLRKCRKWIADILLKVSFLRILCDEEDEEVISTCKNYASALSRQLDVLLGNSTLFNNRIGFVDEHEMKTALKEVVMSTYVEIKKRSDTDNDEKDRKGKTSMTSITGSLGIVDTGGASVGRIPYEKRKELELAQKGREFQQELDELHTTSREATKINELRAIEKRFQDLEAQANILKCSDFFILRGDFYLRNSRQEKNTIRQSVFYKKADADFNKALSLDPFADGVPEKIEEIKNLTKPTMSIPTAAALAAGVAPSRVTNETNVPSHIAMETGPMGKRGDNTTTFDSSSSVTRSGEDRGKIRNAGSSGVISTEAKYSKNRKSAMPADQIKEIDVKYPEPRERGDLSTGEREEIERIKERIRKGRENH